VFDVSGYGSARCGLQGCVESPMTNFCNNKVKSGMALESKSKIQPGKTRWGGTRPAGEGSGGLANRGLFSSESPLRESQHEGVCTGRERLETSRALQNEIQQFFFSGFIQMHRSRNSPESAFPSDVPQGSGPALNPCIDSAILSKALVLPGRSDHDGLPKLLCGPDHNGIFSVMAAAGPEGDTSYGVVSGAGRCGRQTGQRMEIPEVTQIYQEPEP
jgi:hypothetical protein